MENSNNSKDKGAAEKKPDGQQPGYSLIKMVIGVVCIYIATMIITGGVVYVLTTPKDPTQQQGDGGNNNSTNATTYTGDRKELSDIAGNIASPAVVTLPLGNFTWANPDCPASPECPPSPTKCVEGGCKRNPAKKCRERTKEENGTCPATCTPYPKAHQLTQFPTAQLLVNSGIETLMKYPLEDILNNFPPYSSDRLIVVLRILRDTVEKWAESGFTHRCDDDRRNKPPFRKETTKCSFCTDRYDFIRCVMSNNITGRDPSASALPNRQSVVLDGKLHYPEQSPFRPSLGMLPTIIMSDDSIKSDTPLSVPGVKDPQKTFNDAKDMDALLKRHFIEIHKTIRSLWVATDKTGINCRICKDFNENIYNKCLHNSNKRAPYNG